MINTWMYEINGDHPSVFESCNKICFYIIQSIFSFLSGYGHGELLIYLAGFLITLPLNRPRSSVKRQLRQPIKTKSTIIAFFFLLLSSSSLFIFLLLSFSFAVVNFEFIGRKKPAFWLFFNQTRASNFAIYVRFQKVGQIYGRYKSCFLKFLIVFRSHCPV